MVDRLHDSAALAGAFASEAVGGEGVSGSRVPSIGTQAAGVRAAEVFDLVYRQMRRLAGHRDLDELAQIAAEQALRSLPRFEGRSSLSTWTFRICYLTLRKHDRWYRRWLRRFTLTGDGHLPEMPTLGPAVDDRMAQDERVARLRAALDTLSSKQRTVVTLHDLEGLAVDEVAGVVGAGIAAVRSRLRDGRKALARALAQDPYFGDGACRQDGEEPRRQEGAP
jgi:RNA polymerase sigma-70 factor (ECF subfamily)